MKISRISMLIGRRIKENAAIYGISVLVLFGMLSFMFLIIHQWQDSFSGAVQNGVFIIGLFISGGIFTNSMFHEFSGTSSGIWLLSLPADHIEKVVASIIISTVIFLIVYLIIFYTVDFLYLLNTRGINQEYFLNPFKDDFYTFFFMYLLFNAFILLGRVIFIKHSMIKTVLLGILLLVFMNYLNGMILEWFIPDIKVGSSIAFDSFQFAHYGENVKVFLPDSIDTASSFFTRLILPLSMWSLVVLKFKEKQV